MTLSSIKIYIYAHICRIQIPPSLARSYLKPKTWRITWPHAQLSAATQAELRRTWKPAKNNLSMILIRLVAWNYSLMSPNGYFYQQWAWKMKPNCRKKLKEKWSTHSLVEIHNSPLTRLLFNKSIHFLNSIITVQTNLLLAGCFPQITCRQHRDI